jgi:ubiquitin carboxyl-terminal hydrolase 4/11/15
VLNFPCVCKKVSYCSEICKTNDERFHLPRCDRCGSDDE